MTVSDIDKVHSTECEVHVTPWSKELLRDCVLIGYTCLVFEIEVRNIPELGGYFICRNHASYCHILNFCIAKPYQNQGYGRKFLLHILNHLVYLKHLEYVVLEVRPSNKTALRLYESLGFKISEIKTNYYNDDEHAEDAIFLKKVLND